MTPRRNITLKWQAMSSYAPKICNCECSNSFCIAILTIKTTFTERNTFENASINAFSERFNIRQLDFANLTDGIIDQLSSLRNLNSLIAPTSPLGEMFFSNLDR